MRARGGCLILAVLLQAGWLVRLSAIDITNYSPEVNNLYSSGFSTAAPIRNSSPLFTGAGYDWTGLGWISNAPSGRITHVTMISPLHTLSARHASVTLLGSNVRLVNNAGTVLNIALEGTSYNPVSGSVANDLNIAALSRAVRTSEGITPLSILDVSSGNYVNQPLFLVGSDGPTTGTMVATSAVRSQSTSSWGVSMNALNAAYSFEFWESGDSGSPALIPYAGQLTVAGTAWYPTSFASVTSATNYTPAAGINTLLADTGYALKWTVYDNPGDAANTANVWNGSGGGDLKSMANWLYPTSTIVDRPVVFDSAQANVHTVLSLDSSLSLRGILFRNTTATDGFSFQGAGVLSVGMSGITNDSGSLQSFGVDMTLAGAQNWEARRGDLVFTGNINNNGHLLSVGGERDTVIFGVISGAGGLAKDDPGTLVLKGANTYTGTTFLHEGTLRLEEGGSLGSGGVAFIAGNEAILDLNGRNQTVSGIASSYGGTGRILLGGATLTVNSTASGRFYGSIEGAGNLIKTGSGLWELGGENTHSGNVQLNGGVMRLLSGDALSEVANLAFNGGILEVGSGDFTRSLGTGPGQVQFAGVGVGGFSAYGGDRIVNLGGEGATVAWGVNGFVPDGTGFRLSSQTSDSTVDFQNPINLGGAYRGIVVNNGSAGIDARLTGTISNGSLVKHGAGVLELTANNTYSGQTQIYEGGLLITSENALGTGNLVFVGTGGGVLVLGESDFTRELGNGNNLVRFVTGGGFAAYGADRIVNLGGGGAEVTWGLNNFVPDGNLLVLSSTPISTAMVDFQNSINLNGGDRTFQIGDGTSHIDSRLSGVLSNGGIIKTGPGTLELTAVNTYAGQTFINGGTLLESGVSGLGTGNLRLANGGVFMTGTGDFIRALGTGPGEVQFTGSGGFAAYGVDRIVNLGGAGAGVVWGEGGFVPSGNALYLGATSSDATVNFVNPVNLTGGTRVVWVNRGTADVDARMSGVITNGALTKGGVGVLELATENLYSGVTSISGGVLLISHASALPSASPLVLSGGGVLGLGIGDFMRSLGTGAGQIRFAAEGGGFSAYGADRIVNLGGSKATVTWGVANTGITGRLVLSSPTSNATVEWQNPINLGTEALGVRTIEVHNGSAEVDAKMTGVIYTGGVGWGIRKTGNGTLEFAAATSYTGETQVTAGTLIVGTDASMTGSKFVSIEKGATFNYRSSLVALGRPVYLNGGTFLYNSSNPFTGAFTFDSGIVGGSGNLGTTALSIGEGMAVSPGNSTGTLRTGSQTWNNAGAYIWELNDLSGQSGQEIGWDLLLIQGNLTILAGEFKLDLQTPGSLPGWNPLQEHQWTIATVSGIIAGFSEEKISIETSEFARFNDLAGGRFSVVQSGKNLELLFIPVPEPSVSLLAGSGILIFFGLLKSRRRFP